MREEIDKLKIDIKEVQSSNKSIHKRLDEQKDNTKQIFNELSDIRGENQKQDETLKHISETQEKADEKRTRMHAALSDLKTAQSTHNQFLLDHVKWEEKNTETEKNTRDTLAKVHAKWFKIALAIASFIAISIISVMAWMFVMIMDTNGEQKALKEKISNTTEIKKNIVKKQDKMYDAIKDVQYTIDKNSDDSKVLEKRINKVEKYQERSFGYLQGSKINRR